MTEENANDDAVVNRRKETKAKRKRLLERSVVWLVFFSWVWFVLFFNPLPSDNEMIEHLRIHRADIEELIDLHRNYRLQPGEKPVGWTSIPPIQTLLARTGIQYVHNTTGGLWLPKPYSVDTARQAVEMRRRLGLYACRQYCAKRIRLADDRAFILKVRYGWLFKDFTYFPQPPKISGGKLWPPVNERGNSRAKGRVLKDLDRFPPRWKKGECVYRQIEPQWFIRMCRAA